LVQEGLDDLEAGRVVPFTEDLMKKAFEKAKQNVIDGISIPDHVKP
jgi:hypothetical protein